MTFGDFIVLGILAVIVGFIVLNMVRNQKKGSHCGCGSCQGCAMAGKCHQAIK